MEQTFFDLGQARDAGAQVAAGYYWDPQRESFEEVPYMPMKEISGAGAILSNVQDYAKWLRALVDEAPRCPRPCTQRSKSPEFSNPTAPGSSTRLPYTPLGWDTTTYKGHRRWSHNGGSGVVRRRGQLLPRPEVRRGDICEYGCHVERDWRSPELLTSRR